MQWLIRHYRPSDCAAVQRLFSDGTLEHIGPCFSRALRWPGHGAVVAALAALGLLLSWPLAAVVLPAGWVALLYYSCSQVYTRYVQLKLDTDMRDIVGNFLTSPDDCFWVAETEVDGRSQIVGMVAVKGHRNETGGYAELFRMIVAPSLRHKGLGIGLAQTALQFCRERGFSKVVLQTSCIQTAALALYEKLGFTYKHTHCKGVNPWWIESLSRVTVVSMEKSYQE